MGLITTLGKMYVVNLIPRVSIVTGYKRDPENEVVSVICYVQEEIHTHRHSDSPDLMCCLLRSQVLLDSPNLS